MPDTAAPLQYRAFISRFALDVGRSPLVAFISCFALDVERSPLVAFISCSALDVERSPLVAFISCSALDVGRSPLVAFTKNEMEIPAGTSISLISRIYSACLNNYVIFLFAVFLGSSGVIVDENHPHPQ
jgi:hypothetical protein